MMLKEYRIVMPLNLSEYQIGQLYTILETSKDVTGGGQGVEMLKNEPFNDTPLLGSKFTSGQFTHKRYHLDAKIPWWFRQFLPVGMTKVHEKSWNAYPYCRTVLTNPEYLEDSFLIKIETIHLPDRGTTDNAHNLSPSELKDRQVVVINIAEDIPKNCKYNPAVQRSSKTGRGPLLNDWQNSCEPFMCCYKLLTVKFVWWGIQARVESYIHKQYKNLFHLFHCQLFCSIDKWYGLSIAEIRLMEEKVKDELNKKRNTGSICGFSATEE